nr:LOW QUALITY PROTEIN: arf-GAP with Rho-GAP domain, ANK repeat and PH domain-containing protein 3 [Loxodonta africana]
MAAPQDLDIAVWLAKVHLEQYADTFRQHGLTTAGAARGLGQEELRQLGISATGHRKRILRLLQASAAEGFPDPQSDSAMEPSSSPDPQAQTSKPVPKPRTVFGGLSGPATTQRPGPSPALRGPEVSRSPESSPRSPPLPTASSEQTSALNTMEMTPNAIYFGLDLRGGSQATQDITPESSQKAAPTPALRPATGTVHIMDPGCLYYGVQPVGVSGSPDRREGRGVCQDRAEHRLSRQDLEARENAGYASLELPGDSTFLMPTLDTEETSDDLISPYASFSSTADPPMPLLSGWLDKLSPQGNYVFQRRFVQFNGRSLMYFGSDKCRGRGVKEGEKWGRMEEGASKKRPRPSLAQGCGESGIPGDLPLPLIILQLFIVLGNNRANRFWAAALPPGERLHPDASPGPRGEFISRKYRSGLFRKPHPQYTDHSQFLQALCAAVAGPNLLKNMAQLLCVEASEGEEEPWTPSALDGNLPGLLPPDPSPGVYNEVVVPATYSSFLYCGSISNKAGPPPPRKGRDAPQRLWCVLGAALEMFVSESSSEPLSLIQPQDVVCLGVSPPPTDTGDLDRFPFSFELILTGGRIQHFGTDGADSLEAWTSALGKWFSPLSCHQLLGPGLLRLGRLWLRSPSHTALAPGLWLSGFGLLRGDHLFLCPAPGPGPPAPEDMVHLRRLQEISVVSAADTPDKKEHLVLVETGRTLYLQGESRLDFSAWNAAIGGAAGGGGTGLQEQQMSRCDIPIIVDACISFVTQHGLRLEGVYRKGGARARSLRLLAEFRRDARSVKLRPGEHFVEDVTDTLKRFFRELDDPVTSARLLPRWREAAELPQKNQRLEKYKEVIGCLPRVNRRTLATLIGHLYRVQKCAALNQMCTRNLALLFAPSVFQTDGRGEHEVRVLQELIDGYVSVFDIDSDQIAQIDLEVSLITTWKDVQLSQAGDLIMEVYIEQQLPDNCVTLKVSPTLTAEELTNQVLEMRGTAAGTDLWMTFEILEHGELERPLHPKERVLEQALQWCQLPEPCSASLLLRKVSLAHGGCLFTGTRRESPRMGLLRCREEPPRLLGSRFQERFFLLRGRCLLLLKEKKVKPWGKGNGMLGGHMSGPMTNSPLITSSYLSCTDEDEMWDWTTSILKAQHDDQQPVVLRRRSSSDLAHQKFGTMPLLPIRGDDSGATLLSANQTLRRLHNRRTLSMFFPMKSSQGSVDEQEELEEPVYEEPVYEEVGAFPDLTEETSTSSTIREWTAKPENPLPSQRFFDQLLLSKAGTLGWEERPPEPPPGPPSKSSPQAHGSLEEQLLQELSSFILRKGETTTGLGSPSQPSSPQPPSPTGLPTQTSSFPTEPPCTSSLPSSQPLT